MIFMIEILHIVFVIFINEAIVQFLTCIACNNDTLDRLHLSFSLHMYECELWNLSSSSTDKYIIASRQLRDKFENSN